MSGLPRLGMVRRCPKHILMAKTIWPEPGDPDLLYIIEKALTEIEAMPRDKREDLAHLDAEINDAVEKLKALKEKLEATTDKK